MQIFFFTEIHLSKVNLEFRSSITFLGKYYPILYIIKLCFITFFIAHLQFSVISFHQVFFPYVTLISSFLVLLWSLSKFLLSVWQESAKPLWINLGMVAHKGSSIVLSHAVTLAWTPEKFIGYLNLSVPFEAYLSVTW